MVGSKESKALKKGLIELETKFNVTNGTLNSVQTITENLKNKTELLQNEIKLEVRELLK
jgi:hypothetical protein